MNGRHAFLSPTFIREVKVSVMTFIRGVKVSLMKGFDDQGWMENHPLYSLPTV